MKAFLKKLGRVCAIIGGQWGDEGKGKLVDILAEHYDIIVRATGGANAGHTIYRNNRKQTTDNRQQKFVFHLVPAGMLHPGKIGVMGNGMVVHLPTMLEEIEVLKKSGIKIKNNLLISDRIHLVFEYHKIIDRLQEELKGNQKIGTTGRGIGPAYTDKTSRVGIRVSELRDFETFSVNYRHNLKLFQKMYGFTHDGEKELKELKKLACFILPFMTDTSLFLYESLKKKKTILLEGANGTLLDIDHGTYPFVTSSNASIAGLISGSGIAPSSIISTVGIIKAYCTRVGSGPFPTELEDSLGGKIRTQGAEFGATTGRPRRCGWFDAVAARYAVRLNGFTAVNLTKLDVLNILPRIHIGIGYRWGKKQMNEFPTEISVLEQCEVEYYELPGWQEDISKAGTFHELPKNCRKYIETLEQILECPILCIGTGKTQNDMIYR